MRVGMIALSFFAKVSLLVVALFSPVSLYANDNNIVTNSVDMKFVPIPRGTFTMGSPFDEPGRADDEKLHRVRLTKRFFMQTTEVTQRHWYAVMGNNPSIFDDCGWDCPVENVSWFDVLEFIARLNQLEKTNKYRLPTEAEWEYAARAGSRGWFCFGSEGNMFKDYAWYKENSEGRPHPVAQKKPNAWGLYDVHGNVWEWCRDWDGEYSLGSGKKKDRLKTHRVLKKATSRLFEAEAGSIQSYMEEVPTGFTF